MSFQIWLRFQDFFLNGFRILSQKYLQYCFSMCIWCLTSFARVAFVGPYLEHVVDYLNLSRKVSNTFLLSLHKLCKNIHKECSTNYFKKISWKCTKGLWHIFTTQAGENSFVVLHHHPSTLTVRFSLIPILFPLCPEPLVDGRQVMTTTPY